MIMCRRLKTNRSAGRKNNNMTFRVPGAAPGMLDNITEVPEALGYTSAMAACVTEENDEDATGAKF